MYARNVENTDNVFIVSSIIIDSVKVFSKACDFKCSLESLKGLAQEEYRSAYYYHVHN